MIFNFIFALWHHSIKILHLIITSSYICRQSIQKLAQARGCHRRNFSCKRLTLNCVCYNGTELLTYNCDHLASAYQPELSESANVLSGRGW